MIRGKLRDMFRKKESKIKLGICAMDKKVKSKPMQEILKRLDATGIFEIIYFPQQEVIFGLPIESWPVVEALIAFFSTGFPTGTTL